MDESERLCLSSILHHWLGSTKGSSRQCTIILVWQAQPKILQVLQITIYNPILFRKKGQPMIGPSFQKNPLVVSRILQLSAWVVSRKIFMHWDY